MQLVVVRFAHHQWSLETIFSLDVCFQKNLWRNLTQNLLGTLYKSLGGHFGSAENYHPQTKRKHSRFGMFFGHWSTPFGKKEGITKKI